ncbi:beta-N-acetylglucosaminidase domain-containing protein [bacterium AH-315-P07]|nr:beta-N-acetylglucosaminidase domain-containing protein [bacterium AH-315-P07]
MSDTTKKFNGVVEGFYGRPWTPAERQQLYTWMNDTGTLTTYMYAPKDDLLHRGRWRDLYPDAEAAALSDAIRMTTEAGIRFVYSIAPGLDMAYTSESDRAALLAKIDQVASFGCTEFAILFDDIPETLPEADAKTFRSFAHAQSDVSNQLYAHLQETLDCPALLFCPTTYCARMAVPDVTNNLYLNELGKDLNPEIAFLWTGPNVISETISVESIRELAKVIKRKPVIWDNLHANDYDNRRYFAGPYAGRPLEIKDEVLGILTNPNCQFQLNYIPIHSLGQYLAAETDWDPRKNFLELLPKFKALYGFTHPDPESMDITLLTDSFYLPYELGDTAQELITTTDFLFANDVTDWGERYTTFLHTMRQYEIVLAELNNIANREMLYALYGPVWMLREELGLIHKILEWKSKGSKGDCTTVYHLPKTYRGSLTQTLQKYFHLDEKGILKPTN